MVKGYPFWSRFFSVGRRSAVILYEQCLDCMLALETDVRDGVMFYCQGV